MSQESIKALRHALNRYEGLKRQIELQRENELRLENERRERERIEQERRNEKINQSIKSIVWSWPFLMIVTGICFFLKAGNIHSDDLAGEIFTGVCGAGVVGVIGAVVLFILGGGAFAKDESEIGKVFGTCFKVVLIVFSFLLIFGDMIFK